MKNKILLLGTHSFVATGFYETLLQHDYQVDCFSRGNEDRKGNFVTGAVRNINSNKFLTSEYDVAINFIVLKDELIKDNLDYIQSLIEFCKSHKVKKLIHFSSIMVYNYQLKQVDETTPIETLNETTKKGYGEIKIAVDQYLMSIKDTLSFELIFVRPGYVLADGRPCPFIKQLPFNISIIKGDKNSTQPIVKREDIHKALIKIIETEKNDEVYLFIPNDGMTKYSYAKKTIGGFIIPLPKWIFKSIPWLLSKMKIIPLSLYSRFEGMYMQTEFNSSKTEKKLDIKFS
jgi:nucleoside-diphosphate-sugar epimerase